MPLFRLKTIIPLGDMLFIPGPTDLPKKDSTADTHSGEVATAGSGTKTPFRGCGSLNFSCEAAKKAFANSLTSSGLTKYIVSGIESSSIFFATH